MQRRPRGVMARGILCLSAFAICSLVISVGSGGSASSSSAVPMAPLQVRMPPVFDIEDEPDNNALIVAEYLVSEDDVVAVLGGKQRHQPCEGHDCTDHFEWQFRSPPFHG